MCVCACVVDFDGDQFLGTGDLEQTLKLLTRDELAPDEVALVSVKVLEEADVDDDGKLSFGEFGNYTRTINASRIRALYSLPLPLPSVPISDKATINYLTLSLSLASRTCHHEITRFSG